MGSREKLCLLFDVEDLGTFLNPSSLGVSATLSQVHVGTLARWEEI